MSQRTTSEVCPKCGKTATVTWSGIESMGYSQPVREDAVRLDCSSRCQFTTLELAGHFPTKLNG